MEAKPDKPTPKKKRKTVWHAAFLEKLRNTGNVRASALAAGVNRDTVYEHKYADEVFAKAWQSALDDAIDGLEAAAFVRAKNGSDTLLIFLLKSHRRSVYGDKLKHEVSGPNDGPIRITGIQVEAQDRFIEAEGKATEEQP